MRLKLSSGQEIENPTDAQIREALSKLDVARDGEGFAILGPEEITYVQVTGDGKMGFDMEYQLGDIDKHYRADREDFTLDEVAKAFSQYRDGTIDWTDYGIWQRITW